MTIIRKRDITILLLRVHLPVKLFLFCGVRSLKHCLANSINCESQVFIYHKLTIPWMNVNMYVHYQTWAGHVHSPLFTLNKAFILGLLLTVTRRVDQPRKCQLVQISFLTSHVENTKNDAIMIWTRSFKRDSLTDKQKCNSSRRKDIHGT